MHRARGRERVTRWGRLNDDSRREQAGGLHQSRAPGRTHIARAKSCSASCALLGDWRLVRLPGDNESGASVSQNPSPTPAPQAKSQGGGHITVTTGGVQKETRGTGGQAQGRQALSCGGCRR